MGKRYYWLKLSENFFDQKAIKKLRKIAGGDTYTIIYLEMLLVAMKDDGKLYFEGIEEDFCTELALQLEEDVENVRVTVQYLLSKKLMVPCDEDEYLLSQCGDMVGSETADAQRMRAMRERKSLERNNVTQPLRSRYVEIEKERDKRDRDRDRDREELEIEKEREKDKREDKNISVQKAQITKQAKALFEELWELYPKKRGKASVSDKQKRKLLEVGKEDMIKAINNYTYEIQHNGTDMEYVKNGSTFFNSGYFDYLPANYQPVLYGPKKGNKQDTVKGYMDATKGWEEGVNDDNGGI